MKKNLKIQYYGRYVDDFILIHEDVEYLKETIISIQTFLSEYLKLELHPKKIYLQHYSKGVPFLGSYLKPYRTYIGNRTKGNFFRTIREWNEKMVQTVETRRGVSLPTAFLSSINSYLGILKQFSTYRLRRKFLL